MPRTGFEPAIQKDIISSDAQYQVMRPWQKVYSQGPSPGFEPEL